MGRWVTGIFFWGAKSFFLICFPAWNAFSRKKIPISVDPKQISVIFKSEKQKKKSPPLFITFPTSISNFPPSLLQFSFFSSQFSHLFPLFPFSLASFFPIGQQKFPGHKSWGHSAPMHPRLLRHCPWACLKYVTRKCLTLCINAKNIRTL